MIIKIFFCLVAFLVFSLNSYGQDKEANSIEADKIEYLNKSGEIKAVGSVKITRDNLTVMADEISFNKKK